MIYLDCASTTKPLPEAIEAAMPYMTDKWGNPSSIYSFGVDAKRAVEQARADIANTLNVNPENIIFTSGGTESDNWVLSQYRRVICTAVDHHAAIRPTEAKGREGTIIPVDKYGAVQIPLLDGMIRSANADLVSVIHANNEIGTIQPMREIIDTCHQWHIPIHADMVQSYCHVPIDLADTDVDFASFSAHKFNGLPGVGFLYVKEPSKFTPLILGGQQEFGLRAGTENVPGIVAMAAAAKYHHEHMKEEIAATRENRNYLWKLIYENVKGIKTNGLPAESRKYQRLPGILNVSFSGVHSEALLAYLDVNGVCVSAGAACNSQSTEASHVLRAIGIRQYWIWGALRFSVDHNTKKSDLREAVAILNKCVQSLRGFEN